MFRQTLFLTIVVSAVLACNVQAVVIDSNWVGSEEGFWGDANNWDPNIVPDNNEMNTFVVTIDSNSIDASEVEVSLTQSRTTDQLDCYGDVVLSAWTPYRVELTLVGPNGLTNYGDLEIYRNGHDVVSFVRGSVRKWCDPVCGKAAQTGPHQQPQNRYCLMYKRPMASGLTTL